MGQRWSTLKYGHLEESEYEEGESMSLSPEQSQATTEASSSVPVFDRGLCPACPNDIELSNLQSADALNVDARKKEKEACPKPAKVSTPHFSSVKGSSKDSEIVQVTPSVATCRLRPRKSALDHKLETCREALRGQFALGKLGTNSEAIQPPPLMSLAPASPSRNVANLMELTRNNACRGAMLSPLIAKVRGERKLQNHTSQQQYSPAQTLLLFQFDRKRKWSSGLPSLAFDCTSCPATHVKLRARTPLEKPSEGAVTEVVLDLGTGDAMVGRSVRKVIEGHKDSCKGHISRYIAAQRLYQIKYDNGNEESLEWLDLEPCLVAESDRGTHTAAAGGHGDGPRTRPRYKSVDELYAKHKIPSRRAGK
ncbi:hypothetical protein M758_3G116100 [Ceratodon purpureus]|nr:hypothetical protein M758_3G116100 [Ceratodon purpureus]